MPVIVAVPDEIKYKVGTTMINLGIAYGTVMKILPSVNGETTFITSLYGKSPMLKKRFYSLSKDLEPYGGKVWLIDEKTPDLRNKMLAQNFYQKIGNS